MGPGIVILFWLFVGGVFSTFWIASLVLFFISRRKGWKILKWLAASACAGGVMLGLAVASLAGYSFVRLSVPRFVFADTFDSAPPAGVRSIKSKTFWFADESSTYLVFEAEQGVFHSLVPADMKRMTVAEYKKVASYSSEEPPPWWRPITPDTTEIFFLRPDRGRGKKFAGEEYLMTYNARDRLVYYHYLGID